MYVPTFLEFFPDFFLGIVLDNLMLIFIQIFITYFDFIKRLDNPMYFVVLVQNWRKIFDGKLVPAGSQYSKLSHVSNNWMDWAV